MPLSEEELRLLEQMERALVEEDPKFASTLRGTAFRRTARRRAIIAAVVFVAGVAMLMAGAVTEIPILGIAGFVVMLLSATVALTSLRGRARSSATSDASREHPAGQGLSVIDGGRRMRRHGRAPRPQHDSFMERMEERWRRRREQGF